MRLFFILVLLTTSLFLKGQNSNFLVELDKFDPDAAQMIKMMEDNPAEYFDVTDIDGLAHTFDESSSQYQIIWFWSPLDQVSINQIDGINLMNQIFSDRVKFISFAYETETDLKASLATKKLDIPVVANSMRIGELLYGSELGMGRIFLIDKKGIIQKAIPRQFFIDNNNSFNHLRSCIGNLIDENP